MKTLLGGKGANLAEMAKIGLSVPPGFTITTQARNFIWHSISLSRPTINTLLVAADMR
jgi:phosphoenolpyruvate synthase/pyruvate phosphate dikinase